MRPKGVADGQTVNIPLPPKFDKDRWGDADRKLRRAMVSTRSEGRSGLANPPDRLPGKSSKEN